MHAFAHGGVRKRLLYSRLPRMQRDVVGSYGRGAGELENSCDRYAVAVKRSGVVIGHLPRKLSRVCSLFLRRGGVISCTGTGLEIVQNQHGNYYSSSIDRSHQYSYCIERTHSRTQYTYVCNEAC